MSGNPFTRNTRKTGTFTDMTRNVHIWRVRVILLLFAAGLAGMIWFLLIPLLSEESGEPNLFLTLLSANLLFFPSFWSYEYRRALASEICEITGVVTNRWEFVEGTPGGDYKHRGFTVGGLDFESKKLHGRIREGDRVTVRYWGHKLSGTARSSMRSVESLTIHELAPEASGEH